MALVKYAQPSFNDTISNENVYLSIFETSILSISLLFNTAIMAAICFSRRLRTFSNLFVASLSASDFIFAVACEIISTTQLYLTHTQFVSPPMTIILCICTYLVSLSMLCSRIGHFAISVERWLYIAWPFIHLRVITKKSTTCCLITLWMISILSGLHILTNIRKCLSEFATGYSTIDASVHFVLGGLMLVIYIHIGVIIRRQSVAILKSRVTASVGTINRRMTWKIVRLPVTMFGIFFLLATPIVVTNIYFYLTSELLPFYTDYIAYDALRILSLFHTWTNFFVYVLQDKEFRSVLNIYFRKLKCTLESKRVHPVNSYN